MHDIRDEIIKKYKEFYGFLQSISVEDLKKQYTQEELEVFVERLHKEKSNCLLSDLTSLINELQKEQTKAYHFTAIESISFLTEEEKIRLDNKLTILRSGESIAGLREVTKNRSKQKEIEEWLENQDNVQVTFVALCPRCSEIITDCMSEKEKESLCELFTTYKKEYDEETEEKLRNLFTNMCLDCEILEESNEGKELRFKSILQKK